MRWATLLPACNAVCGGVKFLCSSFLISLGLHRRYLEHCRAIGSLCYSCYSSAIAGSTPACIFDYEEIFHLTAFPMKLFCLTHGYYWINHPLGLKSLRISSMPIIPLSGKQQKWFQSEDTRTHDPETLHNEYIWCSSVCEFDGKNSLPSNLFLMNISFRTRDHRKTKKNFRKKDNAILLKSRIIILKTEQNPRGRGEIKTARWCKRRGGMWGLSKSKENVPKIVMICKSWQLKNMKMIKFLLHVKFKFAVCQIR